MSIKFNTSRGTTKKNFKSNYSKLQHSLNKIVLSFKILFSYNCFDNYSKYDVTDKISKRIIFQTATFKATFVGLNMYPFIELQYVNLKCHFGT